MLGKAKNLLAYALLLGVFAIVTLLDTALPTHAAPGVNQQMNFQGRLLTAQGATVPDGFYNLQFKIYQDGDGQSAGNPSGTLKWTESFLNSEGNGVMVKNGYMSVQLGSVNPFGTQVDWSQDTLWLSMNVGNTNTVCASFAACGPDGEMVPMKRLSASPYALNSAQLGGLTSGQFLQLAQGVQTDASTNTSSIFLDKTGSGNFVQLQANGDDVFTLDNAGDVSFGNNADHTISVATAEADTEGRFLTVSAGDAGTGASPLAGGSLLLQGGDGGGTDGEGGSVAIDAGAGNGSGSDGIIAIGYQSASSIIIGNTLGTSNQTIHVGANNAGGTIDLVLGTGGGAAGGSTLLQAKDNVTVSTNGITRATFDTANSLYLGNGVSVGAPNDFTVQGSGSATNAVTGGGLTIQGGNATVGTANGGNLTLRGGDGVGGGADGLVIINTPTFATTANDANCFTGGASVATDCTISTDSVNSSSAIVVGFTTEGKTASLPDPTNTTAGRVVYITAANLSKDFTLSVNGGVGVGNQIAMRANSSATMIWNGNDWTAAGASSSTTLQSAYDNTLQSSGGAELIVSKTSATNGLTIRDSQTNSVNGTLLSVQTSSAAGLISVNSNVTEYASNAGAEVAGGSSSTFPANTWSAAGIGPTVSRQTTTGDTIATGQASVAVQTNTAANTGVRNTLNAPLTANNHYNVSFTARLASGTFTDMDVYYSVNGTAASVPCASSRAVHVSTWTKIDCSFTAPNSGITTNNAILIRQASGTAHLFYVDNLSVTIAADYNLAADGGVDDGANFSTNWPAVGATVTRDTNIGNDTSNSAKVVTTGANQGVRHRLAIAPQASSDGVLYRVTAYVATPNAGFTTFKAQYSPNNGTTRIDCLDYNTQTIAQSTVNFTKVTCYITTTATTASAPYLYFTQTDSTGRTFYVDTVSMTLASSSTPNVQIGGGINGGPTTLFTLDRGASAPIASDNEALLGSMYYDTTIGKLQCYEADGWGACGSSPDSIVTLSPEYTNAVMHGTGVGTMISDICSDTLDINDGSSGQPTICSSGETYNFYKWTSPQATPQAYGIYVTYQLPNTFKSFESGQTSLKARTDSSDASVVYTIYRSDSSGLTACGSAVTVSTGAVSAWQSGQASGAADPSTCGFDPGDSIVFKITVTASDNANAYVSNLGFTFSNR